MDQDVFLQQLAKAGVNTEQAIGRFMGNTALFLRFVQRLPEALRFAEIRQALDAQDDEKFYMLVHTLKLNSLLRETELESERLSKVLRTLDGTAENG